MVCDPYCITCNATGGKFIITGLNQPSPASAGDLVTVSFSVTLNCTVCINNAFLVCLHDTNGVCQDSTGGIWFPSGSNQVNIQLQYIQPTTNFNGRLSVIGKELLGDTCYDSKTFTVTTIAPPGQGYSCNQSTHTCYPNPQSTTTYDQCAAVCSGGGGGGFGTCNPACSADNMCVIGTCVPKPLVFIGIAGLLYLMISGRS